MADQDAQAATTRHGQVKDVIEEEGYVAVPGPWSPRKASKAAGLLAEAHVHPVQVLAFGKKAWAR